MRTNRRLLRVAGRLGWPFRATVAVEAALLAASAGQSLLIAVVLARTVQGAALAGVGVRASAPALAGGWGSGVRAALAGILALIAVRAGLLWLRSVAAEVTAAAVKERLRDQAFAKLLELGAGQLDGARTGQTQSSVVDGVEALECYVTRWLPQALLAGFAPLALTAWVLTVDVAAGLTAASALAVAVGVPRLWGRRAAAAARRHAQARAALAADWLDSLQGMPTLKSCGAGQRRRAELAVQDAAVSAADRRRRAPVAANAALTAFAAGAGALATAGVAAIGGGGGGATAFTLFAILLLARDCFRPFAELSSQRRSADLGRSGAADIFALLDTEPEVREPETPGPDLRAPGPAQARVSAAPGGGRSVAFEGVTFTYPTRGRPAVEDLSLHVEAGETVAIVGPSGSGKSTIAALLLRLHDPQRGRITVGGVDTRELPLARLRAQIAVVAQDTYLFNASVADNLLLAKPHARPAELERAAVAACADEFILALPDAYDTVIGERGVRLSAGQRQRLAIARAVLRNPAVLVLDEATASVDAASESLIRQGLAALSAGRTTLVIAQRLSSVLTADRIIVLRDGHAVEAGAHGELLAATGAYARLVAAQRAP